LGTSLRECSRLGRAPRPHRGKAIMRRLRPPVHHSAQRSSQLPGSSASALTTNFRYSYLQAFSRGSGGTGRRTSLRSWRPQGHRGSNPFSRTIFPSIPFYSAKKSMFMRLFSFLNGRRSCQVFPLATIKVCPCVPVFLAARTSFVPF
jgi:hypothetical protein